MVKRREDLTEPRGSRRIGLQYEPDVFGRFASRSPGSSAPGGSSCTRRSVIAVWIVYNLAAPRFMRFDPWGRGSCCSPSRLSIQAAFAAPLILLAQNRQERRDRTQAELDRHVAERTQADTEFLAREIAGVRVMLADVVTGEELRDQLDDLVTALDLLTKRLDELAGNQAASGDGGTSAVEVR